MTDATGAEPRDRQPPERQILRGITQSLAARALTAAVQFLTLVVLARGLGPEALGVAQFFYVVFTYLLLLSDPGLTVFGTREQGRPTGRLSSAGVLLGARLMLSIILVAAIALASLALSDRSVSGFAVTAVLTGAMVLSALSLRWLLLARHAFGIVAACELSAALLQLAGAVAVHAANLGAVAGLAVLVGGPSVVAVLSWAIAGATGGAIRPSFDLGALRVIRLALPLGVAAMATALYYSVDSLLLGLTRTSTEVGVYAAAYRIVLAGLTLPVIVHGVALPVIAKTVDRDVETTHRIVRGLTGWLMILAFPAAATVALLASAIVEVLYGAPFAASALPLSILVWSLVTVSANVPFAVLLLASRRDRAYVGVTVLGAAVNLSLNLVVIPSFGYVGAAFTTLAAEVTVLASFVWLTRPLSLMTLRAAVPLGIVPAAVVSGLLVASYGEPAVQLTLAIAGFAASMLVLLAIGALREPLAMLGRSPP